MIQEREGERDWKGSGGEEDEAGGRKRRGHCAASLARWRDLQQTAGYRGPLRAQIGGFSQIKRPSGEVDASLFRPS